MPFYTGGEYCSKIFANTHSLMWAVLAVIGYAVSSALWLPALMIRNELLVVDTIWKALAAGFTIMLSLLVFHERPGAIQYIGVAFVFVGILLVK